MFSLLDDVWNNLTELIASGFIGLALVIWWFDSIDQRSKRLGAGWMGIFVGDIQSVISIFSFIVDLAWRVVNTIIDVVMRFAGVFMPF